jgi:(1->4)-alpha-D-glucan 1-alpha-D-glucosylmutase
MPATTARRRAVSRRFPDATYRLQFNAQFTFQDALQITSYLQELGISDCYASPLLKAAPDSTHGYDVCGFDQINPALGTEKDFETWSSRLRKSGLGLILDIVPNHMAANCSNRLLQDVLAHGPDSRFANWFDIDWERTGDGPGKIVLPVLEDHYGIVLEAGKLHLAHEADTFALRYGEYQFPLSPASLEQLRSKSGNGLDKLNGRPGDPHSFDLLEQLLRTQHYRLAYWRVGLEELNYRRFFDVTGLVGLRVELREVFEAAHALVFKWLHQGIVSGLRVDHPDGLWDPKQYFERLRHVGNSSKAEHQPPYVVAEKILTGDERLPADWPIDGTTGYDFLNRVNGVFVDANNRDAFDALYREFTGCAADFSAVARSCKQLVLRMLFQSELTALAHRLKRLSERTRHGADFTLSQLRTALSEVLVAFPVYRSYITEQTGPNLDEGNYSPNNHDRDCIEQAMRLAREANPTLDHRVFDWLERVLRLGSLEGSAAELEHERIDFVMRFQQLTAPLMAKGVEDTAFYNFNRLVSLNEVGGKPGRFGVSVESFHEYNLFQAKEWPHSLLATATHDTKRGEDVRARLNVLSEMPQEWAEAVRRWHNANAGLLGGVAGEPAPAPNDEYLLYQTLVGAWSRGTESAEGLKEFSQRVGAFMLKAVREAKTYTSWLDPNSAYEEAVGRFVSGILSKTNPNPFLNDFEAFQRRVAFFGQFNSLSQTLLKLTSPGVPDIYQGTELWDFSLVDPDNRRPVDFELRRHLLAGLAEEFGAAQGNLEPLLERLLRESDTGEIKLFLLWRALKFRAMHRDLFAEGGYRPLEVSGTRRQHVCALSRTRGSHEVLVVVPRLVFGLTSGVEHPPMAEVWEDTDVHVVQDSAGSTYRNILTERFVQAEGETIPLKQVLEQFPVALLEKLT